MLCRSMSPANTALGKARGWPLGYNLQRTLQRATALVLWLRLLLFVMADKNQRGPAKQQLHFLLLKIVILVIVIVAVAPGRCQHGNSCAAPSLL